MKLNITRGDRLIFKWLWMVRAMTIEQIMRVRYFHTEDGRLSNKDNVTKRLGRLEKDGYLNADKIEILNPMTKDKSRKKIFFLGKQALSYLSHDIDIDQKDVYEYKRFKDGSYTDHALLVTESAIRIYESIRESNISLMPLSPFDIPFYHSRAVGNPKVQKPVDRFVTQCNVKHPEKGILRIRPDLVFALKGGNQTRLFFLEADRGTETHNDISEKLLAFSSYLDCLDPSNLNRKWWQEYGDVHDFRVLIVLTSQRRMENLWQSLRSKPGFEYTAFSTIQALTNNNMAFDPVWKVSQQGSIMPLLKRT